MVHVSLQRTAQQAKERSQVKKGEAASRLSSDITRFFMKKWDWTSTTTMVHSHMWRGKKSVRNTDTHTHKWLSSIIHWYAHVKYLVFVSKQGFLTFPFFTQNSPGKVGVFFCFSNTKVREGEGTGEEKESDCQFPQWPWSCECSTAESLLPHDNAYVSSTESRESKR